MEAVSVIKQSSYFQKLFELLIWMICIEHLKQFYYSFVTFKFNIIILSTIRSLMRERTFVFLSFTCLISETANISIFDNYKMAKKNKVIRFSSEVSLIIIYHFVYNSRDCKSDFHSEHLM